MADWQGVDLGPLQGIPYGLKDLIAVEGYRTTWGAPAYMDQVLDVSANVYNRLALVESNLHLLHWYILVLCAQQGVAWTQGEALVTGVQA